MSKQSSIEWFAMMLAEQGLLVTNDYENLVTYKEAIAMHQTEVEEAYFNGQKNGNSYGYNGVVFVNKAKYYKQTFGIKKNEKRS